MLAVHVEHINDVGKGTKSDNQHYKEDLYVFQDLCDHSNEGRKRLEKSHPVEKLDPHYEDGYGANDLQVIVRDFVGHFAVNVEGVEAERTKVYYVPTTDEVSKTVFFQLDQLQDHKSHVHLSADNKADHLENEVKRELGIFLMREVASVGNERGEVENEGHEQTVEDSIKVALPHKVYEDADLRCGKNLIIF